MLEKDGFIYKKLEAEDLKATIECVVDVFPNSEPLTVALGITKEEFYPFAEITCRFAVSENLSHIAKDIITGNVVGFRISSDLFSESNKEIVSSYEDLVKFHPTFALLESLKRQYLENKNIKKGQVLHWLIVGVKEKYRNRNIAKNLLKLNLEEAKIKQFQVVICETTGVISQHNATKLGFQEIVSIDYKDYIYNETNVFDSIADSHHKCTLMEKILE